MSEYMTAKSYTNCKWVDEPFEESGRMYVHIKETCSRCGGRGRISHYAHIDEGLCYDCYGAGFFVKKVRLYTQKEINAQEAAKARKEARKLKALEDASEANKAAWMEKNGFKDGFTWVVFGDDTFAIKDFLKEQGCKFDYLLKWHSPIQIELPSGYQMISIPFDDIYEWNMYAKEGILKENAKEKVDRIIKEAEGPSKSEYVGEIGERIRNLTAVFKSARGFSGKFGWTNIYTFESESNILVWFTSSDLDIERGATVDFTGTVKDHAEYDGVRQTQFSRCIIKVIK